MADVRQLGSVVERACQQAVEVAVGQAVDTRMAAMERRLSDKMERQARALDQKIDALMEALAASNRRAGPRLSSDTAEV